MSPTFADGIQPGEGTIGATMNQISNPPWKRSTVSRLISTIAAGILGFGIWAASPALTGVPEPWDSEYPYYLVLSIVGGGTLGFFYSKHLLFCYVGAWSGQIVALAVLPGLDRGWILLGVMTTAIGSLLILLGAVIGWLLRKGLDRPTSRRN